MIIVVFVLLVFGFKETDGHYRRACPSFNFMCSCQPLYQNGCFVCPASCNQGYRPQNGFLQDFHPGEMPALISPGTAGGRFSDTTISNLSSTDVPDKIARANITHFNFTPKLLTITSTFPTSRSTFPSSRSTFPSSRSTFPSSKSTFPTSRSTTKGQKTSSTFTNAQWSQWFSSPCSVTCGTGSQLKLRHCSSGCDEDCPGSPFSSEPCNLQTCRGYWLPYQNVSSCSVTCGTGFVKQRRYCSTGVVADCIGNEYNETPCHLRPC